MAANAMRKRIAALIAKSRDKASTEAEAMSAAAAAQRLMQSSGLTLEDVTGDNAETVGESKAAWRKGRVGDSMQYAQGAIAKFTGCGVCFCGNASIGTQQIYYGYGPERDLAIWLHDTIAAAIARESKAYAPPPGDSYDRSRARRDFALGMSSRIAQRLYEMAKEGEEVAQRTSTGRELVLVRGAAIHPRLQGKLGPQERRNPNAFGR